MGPGDLGIEPLAQYSEGELRDGGLLERALGYFTGADAESLVLETPFCRALIARLESWAGRRILPLSSAMYCMLRRDPSFTESFWHIDVEEWTFDNTYNVWLPLVFVNADTDGLDVLDGAEVREFVAKGYGQIDDLDDHMFKDEIVRREGLDHTRYFVQFDARQDYRLWPKAQLTPAYVRPQPFAAHLLNARVFHRTSPALEARLMWGFKFALEDAGPSGLRRIPSERAAAWSFHRRHGYKSPDSFRGAVRDSLARRSVLRAQRVRALEGASAQLDALRQGLFPDLAAWLAGRASSDALRAGLQAASESLGGLPHFSAELASGFRPFS